jgi:hypothetical protein
VKFREQRRRKWILRDNQAQALREKKSSMAPPSATPQVQTRNYYAPLRNKMEVEARQVQDESQAASESAAAEGALGKAGRQPPIILTSAANLIQLQKEINTVAKQTFEFLNTGNGTRVTTMDMVDYLEVKAHFDSSNMFYFTFFPKSLKPVKAVIRHFPHNTPEEDLSDEVIDLKFYVIRVKQMSSTFRIPDEGPKILPLFLITFTRTTKS